MLEVALITNKMRRRKKNSLRSTPHLPAVLSAKLLNVMMKMTKRMLL
jgi:hypothetical protein